MVGLKTVTLNQLFETRRKAHNCYEEMYLLNKNIAFVNTKEFHKPVDLMKVMWVSTQFVGVCMVLYFLATLAFEWYYNGSL
jgi:hypothetical protein